jgi:hypothetical protein
MKRGYKYDSSQKGSDHYNRRYRNSYAGPLRVPSVRSSARTISATGGTDSQPRVDMDRVVEVSSAMFDNYYRDLSTVHDMVGRISYKKGWEFKMDAMGYLWVRWKAQDAVTLLPMEEWVSSGARLMNVSMAAKDPEYFTQFVYNLIKECELHEAAEFFRYNNQMITDPHATSDAISIRKRIAYGNQSGLVLGTTVEADAPSDGGTQPSM